MSNLFGNSRLLSTTAQMHGSHDIDSLHNEINVYSKDEVNQIVQNTNGPLLQNINLLTVPSESIITINPNDTVAATPVSSYGKQLLNETSFAALRTSILEGSEEAIKYTGDSVNEILFHTNTGGVANANNLRFKITDTTASLENNVALNCHDVNVNPNKSLIASYIGSDGGNNLNLRFGSSVYQQFNANGIELNQNVTMAHNKYLKQKIEDSDSRVFVESLAKRQYCIYSYEAGSNSGMLVQVDASDILAINNYKNSVGAYKPISINRSTASYVVCGANINPTSINSNFVSNGTSVFCNGATPLMLINSSNIKPYVDIIPDGPNAYDLGNAANYFGNLHVNSINLKNDLFIDFFNSTDIKNDGFFFRSGFGSGSGIGDNMSIRGHNNSGANDGIAISAYGGVSINCGAISVTNDNGTDAATNRVMLLGTTINNHRNMLPSADGAVDIGSASFKFNQIYGNNLRANSSLYSSHIRPYSGSNVKFHNTSISTDSGNSLSVDRVESTSGNTDLLIGNAASTKLAIKGGPTGNVELVAPAIVPPVDTTNSIGTGAYRFGSINGMIVAAWTKLNTELIQHLGSGVIELDGAAIRPYTNGNINLGDATKRWAEVFAVNGTINTSDRNAKRDIEPIKGGDALNFVRKLEPVKYKWKDGGKRWHTGFISQDVLKSNPLGLSDNWAGYVDTGNGLGLRYSEFISINTQSIKELDLENTRLKQQNTALEQRVLRLEKMLEKLILS